MEYTESQKTEFKAQFATKRRRQIIAVLPFLAVFAWRLLVRAGTLTDSLGTSEDTLVIGMIAVVVAMLGYSLYNWRCPACNRYLGKSMSAKFCRRCGVELS